MYYKSDHQDNSEETLKERTKAHLAGLFDSDGTICISPHNDKRGYTYYGVSVAVYNKHLPLMKYLLNRFGGRYRRVRNLYSWQPQSNNHTKDIVSLVLPYLILKQKFGLLILEFLNLGDEVNPDARRNLFNRYEEIKGSLTTETPHIPLWNQDIINAFFAGFFDGEGSIGVYPHKQSKQAGGKGFFYKPRVNVTNTERGIVALMQQTYGGGFFFHDRKNDSTRRRSFIWSLNTNKQIELFLLKMLPYLEVKTEQAKLMLDFVRLSGKCPDERKILADKIKSLKWIKIQSELDSDIKSTPMETLEVINK